MWHILCDLCGWKRIFDRSFIGVGRVEAQRLTRTFSTLRSAIRKWTASTRQLLHQRTGDATHDRVGFWLGRGFIVASWQQDTPSFLCRDSNPSASQAKLLAKELPGVHSV